MEEYRFEVLTRPLTYSWILVLESLGVRWEDTGGVWNNGGEDGWRIDEAFGRCSVAADANRADWASGSTR